VYTDQVVGGERDGEAHAGPIQTAKLRLARTGNCLQPTEDFLNPLALLLADTEAWMVSG